MVQTGLACIVCGGRFGVMSTITTNNTVTRYRKCLNCGRRIISEETIVREGRARVKEVASDSETEDTNKDSS